MTVVWFFFFLKGLLLIFIYTSHLLSKCIFTDSLKIGDYVIFSDTVGCFLSVEGILLEELVAVDTITSLHDSVFCVHLQRQYSAARELNAFLEKYGMDVKNITDDSELKYLQALERGTENENKLNDNYMRKKLGQVVLFGDIIQVNLYCDISFLFQSYSSLVYLRSSTT